MTWNPIQNKTFSNNASIENSIINHSKKAKEIFKKNSEFTLNKNKWKYSSMQTKEGVVICWKDKGSKQINKNK